VRDHQGDDHEGPQAHACDRGRARRGRAGGSGRHRLNTAEIFDRAAATYDVAAFPFFTPFGEALVEFAAVQPGERGLDVGCGTAAALAPAARITDQAVGIELSPKMAERAREAAPNADVVVGDAGTLPFEDGSFDVVLSSFVVFFFEDPTAALAEWRRVLAPDGRFAMATWGGGDPRWSWEREVRMPYATEVGHERLHELMNAIQLIGRFDEPTKLEGEMRAAGFEPQEVRTHPIEFVFGKEDDWWDWNWSHGSRVFLEELGDDARERFKRDAYERMQQNRVGTGFPRTYTALFTRATP
jgi:ubiquinone/menaquinone biosynthesis C-methylase UbiE